MQLRSYIEAIDLPTIYYIYYNYTMMSVQQMNLLPENASQNDTILPTSLYHIYQTIYLAMQYLCNHRTCIERVRRDRMAAKTDRMILNFGIYLLLFFIRVAKIDYCYASQYPELHILQGEQTRGIFWPGSTARLKCVFPEEMAGLTWYVNGSEQPIEWRLLSEDYKGHSLIAQ